MSSGGRRILQVISPPAGLLRRMSNLKLFILKRSVPVDRTAPAHSTFWDGVRAAAPVMLGYVPIGFAFGVLARGAGLSVAEIGLMSLLVYAGS
ncbi:MAG TPA: AzlC family ABC transporter permease, partial [Symbiobacteriaceae bacterium]|nr:AzlC family ABC transporter permease [Symbiobacteriaceae bacterium]